MVIEVSICLATDGAADTKHVRILNCSDRELRFELSWPAHCLTITPQHGIIEPQYDLPLTRIPVYACIHVVIQSPYLSLSFLFRSHLQILISPNPSLATKSSMLPWVGQIYVQCDNQQKVLIRLCTLSVENKHWQTLIVIINFQTVDLKF